MVARRVASGGSQDERRPAMTAQVELADEEVEELLRLTKNELENCCGELHHTTNPEYRGQVREHRRVLELILRDLSAHQDKLSTSSAG